LHSILVPTPDDRGHPYLGLSLAQAFHEMVEQAFLISANPPSPQE